MTDQLPAIRRFLRLPLLLIAALLCGGPATAQLDEPATAASLLFETPQWAGTKPGDVLTYRYLRKSADEQRFGPSFEDEIRLHLEKGERDEARTVRVELFGPARRRASGPFEDISSNPVLMLFLEHHVEQLSRALRANPRYLKNAIRAALRDKARIDTRESSVGGRPVAIRQVTVEPFLDDPNKARMNGLESLQYSLAVSEEVPGQITELVVTAALPDGSTALDERLVYDAKHD